MRRLHLLVLALLSVPCLFSQTYTIKTIAGGAPLAVGGPATKASVGQVYGVAVDTKGNLFFTSSYYQEVLRVDAQTGDLSVIAGNGTAGYSGDGGSATSAQLHGPAALAVDASGNIYVADAANYRVRIISNGVITTVAGNGFNAFGGDGGPATMASLSSVGGLAVDSAGNLFIADSGNNRIREVSGGIITTVAGNGSFGSSNGDGGPATAAGLWFPYGVAVSSSGDLYIADDQNGRVRKVSNGVITTVAGTAGTLRNPTGIAIDSSGNLIVAAEVGQSIVEVSNGVLTTIVGNGTAGFSGDNGPASGAELSYPFGVAFDSTGNVFIADTDNSRVRKVASGVITTVVGNGLIGDGGPATSAQLAFPFGIAVDTLGNLYVSEPASTRVREVSNGIITTAASLTGSEPQGIAVDAAGNLFAATSVGSTGVVETSNGMTTTVIKGTSSSACKSGSASLTDLSSPEGIAVDSAGNIYLADTGAYCVLKDTGGTVSPFAGTEVFGFDSGNGGPALDAAVPDPAGLAIDSAGNLFISEGGSGNSVRKVSNGVITAVAGPGPSGWGFAGDNGPATSAQMHIPEGVAVDASGNVFIADTYNNRIRKVSNGVITTIAGTGTANFSGDGGPATSAELNLPSGVAVDAAGNVYVADQNNNRIRMLIPSGPSSSCTASATASTLSPPAAAGTFTVNILTATACAWAIQNLPAWITWSGNPVGMGPAAITLSVAANTGTQRSAIISVAGTDLTITQQAPPGFPAISANGIVPIYSTSSIVEPGSWVSIFGSNLATETALWNNDFPTSLGGVTVTFNGVPAYLWYVSPGQINLQLPSAVALGSATVAVVNSSGTGTSTVQVSNVAPSLSLFPGNRYAAAVILTPNGSGAYQNGSYDLAGPSGYFSFNTRPVKPGETLVLYGVGFGPTNPTVPAGKAFTASAPTTSPVTVSIGGVAAQVLYSGITSAGLYQINLIVPANAASGDQLLVAQVLNTPAQSSVYITVQ